MSFSIDTRKLRKLIDLYYPNNHAQQLKYILHLRGEEELYINLQTSPFQGISTNSIQDRKLVFGSNQVKLKLPSISSILLNTFCTSVIYIPFVISFSIFILQFSKLITQQKHGIFQGLLALIVSICNWILRCLDQLWYVYKTTNSKNTLEDQICTVVRQNTRHQIKSSQLVVGDIVQMKEGDRICADGWLIQGFDFSVSQSYTLETYDIKKDSLKNCIIDLKNQILQKPHDKLISQKSPVILSGSTVKSGQGRMIVLAVGKLSKRGQFHYLSQHNKSENLIDLKLKTLQDNILYYLLITSALYVSVFLVLLVLQCVLTQNWPLLKIYWQWQNLLIGIRIVLIGMPQGLTLGVYIGLFLIKIKLRINEQIKVDYCTDCTRIAVVSQICYNKQNQIQRSYYKEWWNQQTIKFKQEHKQIDEESNIQEEKIGPQQAYFDVEEMNQEFRDMIGTSLKFRSTKHPGQQYQLTTQAILKKKISNDWSIFEEIISQQSFTYICDHGIIIYVTMVQTKLIKQDYSEILFVKGKSEEILDKCTHMMHKSDGKVKQINSEVRTQIKEVIKSMKKRMNETYCIAYQILDQAGSQSQSSLQNQMTHIQNKSMIFLCLLGISGNTQHNEYEYVRKLKQSGVNIMLVSSQARQQSIDKSKQIGINTVEQDNLAMDGHSFMRLISDVICNNCKRSICICEQQPEPVLKNLQEFRRIIKHFKVLYNATFRHKYALLVAFNHIHQSCAYLATETDDFPALAYSYSSIGLKGSHPNNYNISTTFPYMSLKKLYSYIGWSRFSIYFIRKYLQLILPACIVPCTIMLVSGLAFQQNPFNLLQILWVNLILCCILALNLSWQKPLQDVTSQNQQSFSKNSHLITERVQKQIVSQCVFQVTLLLILMLFGHLFIPQVQDSIDTMIGSNWQAKYSNPSMNTVASGLNNNPLVTCPSYRPILDNYGIYSRHLTVVYNIYALMQIFNYLNCRRIKQKQINILQDIQVQNVVIFIATLIMHFLFINFLNDDADLYPQALTLQQWLLSIGLAMIVWVVSFLTRLLPKHTRNSDNCKNWQNKSQNLSVKLVTRKLSLSQFQTQDDIEFKNQ